jgi:hypothetical protein
MQRRMTLFTKRVSLRLRLKVKPAAPATHAKMMVTPGSGAWLVW